MGEVAVSQKWGMTPWTWLSSTECRSIWNKYQKSPAKSRTRSVSSSAAATFIFYLPHTCPQVQKSLITLYLTINNSMMTALESADSLIRVAQDKTKDQSPLINTALEQLTKATGELSKAARRVGGLLLWSTTQSPWLSSLQVQDLLEKIKEENETEGKSSK